MMQHDDTVVVPDVKIVLESAPEDQPTEKTMTDSSIPLEEPPKQNEPTTVNELSIEMPTQNEQTNPSPSTPVQISDEAPLVEKQENEEWKISANTFKKQDLTTVKTKKRKVRDFYERQNEQVDEFLTLEQIEQQKTQEQMDESAAKNAREALLEKIALRLSYASNIFLFIIKIVAAILSLSLSVITSAIDSSLDLLSGFILFITNYIRRRKGKKDKYLYPVGKTRFEPLGFIMFACVMCTASAMIIKEGVQGIIEGVNTKYINVPPAVCQALERSLDFNNPFFWVGVGVMGFTAIWKFILFLFCRTITWSPAVQAYAMDHRNDVLSNIFLLISLTVSGLVWFLWWTDFAGAIVLSLYIIQSWIRNSFEYIKKIVGTSADPEFLQRITFLSLNHHKQILKIDTVQAFFIGVNLYVEVDVVLHPETKLMDAHDIGESLQKKIENLADVERAFVHLDYEYDHHRDSEHKRIE